MAYYYSIYYINIVKIFLYDYFLEEDFLEKEYLRIKYKNWKMLHKVSNFINFLMRMIKNSGSKLLLLLLRM